LRCDWGLEPVITRTQSDVRTKGALAFQIAAIARSLHIMFTRENRYSSARIKRRAVRRRVFEHESQSGTFKVEEVESDEEWEMNNPKYRMQIFSCT
jgi:hypothetical protein